ncbi:DeoR family transcriptional regulator [Acetonema longum DSM 6540]|uniref:DeoR family transcriptional regulator n=1 Tax=Acetonema longum DSM 6540 TaxID=1009370 RepID=F7NEX8_9FIRM|nr:DeoR family transcriptional regulator [Acetonema longum DSM 6540]
MIFILGIERRQQIMEHLLQDNKVYVGSLSKIFKVTEETIRRDLEKLENEGLLQRSHGGAVLKEPTGEDFSFAKRAAVNCPFKQNLAEKAKFLINDGDTIMVDSSTTALTLMHLLVNKKNITIITNSIKLLNDFADANFKMISCGGDLRTHSCALVGTAACRALTRYYVDFTVISCKGIDREKGIMESNEAESHIKQQMIRQAKSKLLLVDHTKFDKIAFTKTMDFNEIDYIVTDQEPDALWVSFLRKQNVKLIY